MLTVPFLFSFFGSFLSGRPIDFVPSEWNEKEQWHIPAHIDLDEELAKLRASRAGLFKAAPAQGGGTGGGASGPGSKAQALSGGKAPRKIKLKGIALPSTSNAAATAIAAASATSAAVEKAHAPAAPVSMETDGAAEPVKAEPTAPVAQTDVVKTEVKTEVKEETAAASSPMELC